MVAEEGLQPEEPPQGAAASLTAASAGLLDPSTLSDAERQEVLAAAAAGTLLLLLLPVFDAGLAGDLSLSALFGGGAASVAALREGPAGQRLRDAARGAVDKAVEVEKQYELGSQATAKYKEWVAKATKAVGELVRHLIDTLSQEPLVGARSRAGTTPEEHIEWKEEALRWVEGGPASLEGVAEEEG
ncbi:hypothetical protein EMIHUDRAFT_211236 [Emiliania huxleyi CCMP1516]|uniref:Uncharacterized protein n=2 Tax=Emiliania huxleyi TaxID=2903 RepID=A0A0D3IWN8_EMIH1|nr:hypothetical protein EMIHUDRAFT_211236 [Emiliania huxleyi CCMP1516]EOD15673.1 hypothetical protein EMIHUDRAFT_211236 [Emiliania huxleyi CCMP1516]|eukprot:XP_005768102.1 hypothetical protein EMIHUDRAFT_211236 [Emiliania huxleyi CCMP1516]